MNLIKAFFLLFTIVLMTFITASCGKEQSHNVSYMKNVHIHIKATPSIVQNMASREKVRSQTYSFHHINVFAREENDEHRRSIYTETATEKLISIDEILNQAEWRYAKISWSRREDIIMERYIEEAETFIKLDTYQLWISPSGEYVEIYEQQESRYTKLDKEQSSSLLSLLKEQE